MSAWRVEFTECCVWDLDAAVMHRAACPLVNGRSGRFDWIEDGMVEWTDDPYFSECCGECLADGESAVAAVEFVRPRDVPVEAPEWLR